MIITLLLCSVYEVMKKCCGVGVRNMIVLGIFFDLFGFSERWNENKT
jgi:hypothetical protein